MYIKFIKEHSAGIAKGKVADVLTHVGKDAIDTGYAEVATEKEFKSYQEAATAKAKKDSEEIEKEAVKANDERIEKKVEKNTIKKKNR